MAESDQQSNIAQADEEANAGQPESGQKGGGQPPHLRVITVDKAGFTVGRNRIAVYDITKRARPKGKILIRGQHLDVYDRVALLVEGKQWDVVELHKAYTDTEPISFFVPNFDKLLGEGRPVFVQLFSKTVPAASGTITPYLSYSTKTEAEEQAQEAKEKKEEKGKKGETAGGGAGPADLAMEAAGAVLGGMITPFLPNVVLRENGRKGLQDALKSGDKKSIKDSIAELKKLKDTAGLKRALRTAKDRDDIDAIKAAIGETDAAKFEPKETDFKAPVEVWGRGQEELDDGDDVQQENVAESLEETAEGQAAGVAGGVLGAEISASGAATQTGDLKTTTTVSGGASSVQAGGTVSGTAEASTKTAVSGEASGGGAVSGGETVSARGTVSEGAQVSGQTEIKSQVSGGGTGAGEGTVLSEAAVQGGEKMPAGGAVSGTAKQTATISGTPGASSGAAAAVGASQSGGAAAGGSTKVSGTAPKQAGAGAEVSVEAASAPQPGGAAVSAEGEALAAGQAVKAPAAQETQGASEAALGQAGAAAAGSISGTARQVAAGAEQPLMGKGKMDGISTGVQPAVSSAAAPELQKPQAPSKPATGRGAAIDGAVPPPGAQDILLKLKRNDAQLNKVNNLGLSAIELDQQRKAEFTGQGEQEGGEPGVVGGPEDEPEVSPPLGQEGVLPGQPEADSGAPKEGEEKPKSGAEPSGAQAPGPDKIPPEVPKPGAPLQSPPNAENQVGQPPQSGQESPGQDQQPPQASAADQSKAPETQAPVPGSQGGVKSFDKAELEPEFNQIVNASLSKVALATWISLWGIPLGALVGNFLWLFKDKIAEMVLDEPIAKPLVDKAKSWGVDLKSIKIKFSLQVKAHIIGFNAVTAAAGMVILVLLGIFLYVGCTNPLGEMLSSATNYNASAVGLLGGGSLCQALMNASNTVGLTVASGPSAPSNSTSATGSCSVLPAGDASPGQLSLTCFGSNTNIITTASIVAAHESGGNPAIGSTVDICRDASGNPVTLNGQTVKASWGLFQINITAHPIGTLNCPSAFDKMYTAQNHQCNVVNPGLYAQCVTAATTASINIQTACQLSGNGTNWGPWQADINACGISKTISN